jgi:hypothetical protein
MINNNTVQDINSYAKDFRKIDHVGFFVFKALALVFKAPTLYTDWWISGVLHQN